MTIYANGLHIQLAYSPRVR